MYICKYLTTLPVGMAAKCTTFDTLPNGPDEYWIIIVVFASCTCLIDLIHTFISYDARAKNIHTIYDISIIIINVRNNSYVTLTAE